MKKQHITLAIGGSPPTEFRLFRKGENETTKGTFLFDDKAAKLVMAEYQAHGIDLALDYGHAMVDGAGLDPAEAGRAAGWFNLEVRSGELWAVNVRWTDAAAAAIRAKEWRFTSPAFSTDREGRVTSILNVAIVNVPATRKLQPLIAASKGTKIMKRKHTLSAFSLDTAKQALEAIKSGDADAAMAILEEMIATAASGDAEPQPAEAPAPDDAPIDSEDIPPLADVAASRTLLAITGTTTLAAALATVKSQQRELSQITAERDEHVADVRITLCRKLVTSGAKTPGQVWDQGAYKLGETPVPKKYLALMSLPDLREFVESEAAAVPPHLRPRTVVPGAVVHPPVTLAATSTPDGGKIVRASYGEVQLKAREVAMFGDTPEGLARLKVYVEQPYIRRRHEQRQGQTGGAR